MSRMFVVLGVLALIVGAIWIGQGTGVFPYPATSFMVRQTPWAFYGGGLVLVGIVLLGLARRR
ncbi:hypothetical protein JQ557_20220 [Bradyrhizobium sp. U87765 SZCCT0131]|uniref:hypothetical protein n=1 Tax=unclassified Bradyrhizobium TaxID=2631580 RepID=UPI001BA599AA|nr:MULTISPECIES: hypothetical protein [unclassified Bradyrhizobium]MBR1220338.1 hypothetical protein [Bradyrhizobium sp. U87765 SZCCT0131]MBR1263207.1 hypothetical protein [Bradyrhizobium sp. U87765 SZCCT0134]MBR1306910.1 hypothetical protein [Bradyrhizobium sp. U87765 SZCCT0110]MBR1323409.1 hypothetical protein [Bradyrhizobium sp. U87765 SZCCT0109]MBR1345864.1 hypothetical protein [Bradyrhizobium sp. U87765 SZCCT0048]